MSDKKRIKLSAEDTVIIRRAIEECEGKLRQAHRSLSAEGLDYGYGSVQRVAAKDREEGDLSSRLAAAEANNRSIVRQLATVKRWYGEALEFNDEILAAIHTVPVPKRTVSAKHISGIVTPIMAPIADWHIGEVIRAEDIEGFNAYNYDIASRRVERLTNKILHWVETERHGHNINEIHIPIVGDMITGMIHDELIVNAEFPIPECVVKSSHLIAQHISGLSQAFDKVYVHALKCDNHSRLTKKKPTKRAGMNSFNHIIVEMVQLLLGKHDNLVWTTYESQMASIEVAGQVFLTDHGDTVRANLGTPYYAFDRQDGKEALKRMRAGKPFDERMRAHWHIAGAGQNGITCGCLCGTTELDAQAGRYSKPYQISFLVHPKYGWFNFTRWDMSDIV